MTNDFYSNVYQHKNRILVRGYRDGQRYKEVVNYRPYVFLPQKDDKSSPYRTLSGEKVSKLEFDSLHSARKFVKDYETVDGFKFYGLTRFVYTYINDKFPGEVRYDPQILKTWIIDIETDSSEKFGDPSLGDTAITCIGVRIGKKRIVFALGDFFTQDKNIIYIRAKNEADLLRKFLNLWADEELGPDIITGWNIEAYDIPFIINRITRVLGADEVKRLSPWGIIEGREIQGKYGKEQTVYTIAGISILDYYLIYRKFTYTQLESYSLDHVSFHETGRGKLDISEYENLNHLFQENHQKFIEYNIIDLDRVAEIDEKNKFIELVMAIAYDAKINLIDSLTSVLLWDVIGHNYLLSKGIVIPQKANNPHMSIPGAYVKKPHIGMSKWVVCFDFTSLYPKLINLLNISPETLIDFNEWGMKEFNSVLEGTFDKETLKQLNVCQAANGARYRKDKHGFLPELMSLQFAKRVEYKNKMLDAKKENEKNPSPELEKEIARCHNLQQAKKIQLNSLYGSLANEYYRFYDFRLSSAITLTGQLAVKWIEKTINSLMSEMFGEKDYIIAIDTDSVYINCQPFMMEAPLDKRAAVEFLDNIMNTIIQPVIDSSLIELADTLNAYEQALTMKREAIADVAIWRAPKMYIMNVLNSEGVQYAEPQLKMMGIEAIRSSTPIVCRDAIKATLKLIMTDDNDAVIKYIESFKERFMSLPFEDVAFPRGINGIEKYADEKTLAKSGTPIHVRGALVYNEMIRQAGLVNKYSMISDKEKVKFCYLKLPNPAFSHVIAAPKILPKILELDAYIDREKQYDKAYLEPIKSILTIIDWKWEDNWTVNSLFE